MYTNAPSQCVCLFVLELNLNDPTAFAGYHDNHQRSPEHDDDRVDDYHGCKRVREEPIQLIDDSNNITEIHRDCEDKIWETAPYFQMFHVHPTDVCRAGADGEYYCTSRSTRCTLRTGRSSPAGRPSLPRHSVSCVSSRTTLFFKARSMDALSFAPTPR